MMRPMEPAARVRTGAVILAAALLFCGEASAQAAGGGGPLDFLGNIFSGSA
jgi:membrane-bound lytic murein transglycosylase B